MPLDSNKISNKFKKGLELFKNRRFAESEKLFKKIFKYKPDDVLINFFLGAAYFETRKFSLSQERLKKVISIESNHRDANFLLGMMSYNENRFDAVAKVNRY